MTALWRFHDAALEKAALILAIARSEMSDVWGYSDLKFRQTIALYDLLHEFAYSTRKAIERTETMAPGIIQKAKATPVHRGRTEFPCESWNPGETIALVQESFWWVVNRIMHSTETLVVDYVARVEFHEASRTGQHWAVEQPRVFGFRSDYDQEQNLHHVHTESFVMAYVHMLSPDVEAAIGAHFEPTRRSG
ncbi:MAG: hypothetical protein IPK07_19090 [Deltaproteobacteria bacterium]|nr:hypothetical protein [Deltaproteobacteria bacterium]